MQGAKVQSDNYKDCIQIALSKTKRPFEKF